MTLDGKIATHTLDSRWVSSDASREIVHRLRGRVDGIMIGRATAAADDPLLTARPPGPRTAVRIVLDSTASLADSSQLVRTARETPVLVATGPAAAAKDRQRLTAAGCEVIECPGESHADRLAWLLDEFGRRQMTNILVEGGAQLLGSLLDLGQIDEVHAFIAPKLIGGSSAVGAIGGAGADLMAHAQGLSSPQIEQRGDDVYIHGRIARVNRYWEDRTERAGVRCADVAPAWTFLGTSMRYRCVSVRKKIAPRTNAGEASVRPSK